MPDPQAGMIVPLPCQGKPRGRLVRRITACGARHPIEHTEFYERMYVRMMPTLHLVSIHDLHKNVKVTERVFVHEGEFERTEDGYPIYILREQL